jgi:type-F conjugative transfer system pilin assembly protein TrbC
VLRVLTAALGLALAAGGVHAQAPDAVDAERACQAAAQALQRAEVLRSDGGFLRQLQQEREALSTAIPSPLAPLDPGALPSMPRNWLGAIRSPSANAGRTAPLRPLLVLVSLSMPETELRELARQAARIQSPLVLRGLVDDSLPATQRALARFGDVPGAAFTVDPTLFRRFAVAAVPTYVLPLQDLQTCGATDCPVPRHVKLAGDTGLDHVLDQIATRTKDADARQLARRLRARLEVAP